MSLECLSEPLQPWLRSLGVGEPELNPEPIYGDQPISRPRNVRVVGLVQPDFQSCHPTYHIIRNTKTSTQSPIRHLMTLTDVEINMTQSRALPLETNGMNSELGLSL